MEKTLKVSISGIRGIIGAGLDAQTLVSYVNAYASLLKPASTIVLGRDTRISGGAIASIVSGALAMAGHTVLDVGIVPTPTVLFTVRKRKLAGGIIVTASHNPIEWNALKFVGEGGRFLVQSQIDALIRAENKNAPITNPALKTGGIGDYPCAIQDHVDAVVASVDAKKIRAAKFTVACDFVNGTGLTSTPILMEKLGVRLVSINHDLTGTFAHVAEPSPGTMKDLAVLVKKTKADIGFTQDPDADRLALTDERGTIVSEEYTLALCAEHLFSKKRSNAAVNLSTSRMIDDIAKKYRRTVLRTKIGEINVSETLRQKRLYFGGEGNGGIIVPSICPGRDSLLGMALLLEMMALRGKRVSELIADIPAYRIIKDKVEAKGIDVKTLYAALKRIFAGARFSEIDGIRADVESGWVHVRTSNTEPVIRIIAEAKDETSARELIEKAKSVIR